MLRVYDNTMFLKSFQVYLMVDINFVKKKKKVKSSMVGDL